MKSLEIEEDLYNRLCALGGIFGPSAALKRLIEAAEKGSTPHIPADAEASKAYTLGLKDVGKVPHSKFVAGYIDGGKAEASTWNEMVAQVLEAALSKEVALEELLEGVTLQCSNDGSGKPGYKFFKSISLWIQGTSADYAARAIWKISNRAGLETKVKFEWNQNEKAFAAGKSGTFSSKID